LKSWLKIADQKAYILKDLIISLRGGVESDNYGNIGKDGDQESDSDGEVVELWEVE
jgi:hypothetical protein